jgi:hypothetical protein
VGRLTRLGLVASALLAVALTVVGLGRPLAHEQRLPALRPNALEQGNVALHDGRWRDAAHHFRQVVSISPEEKNAWFYLGVAVASDGDAEALRRDYDLAQRTMPSMVRPLAEGARLAPAWRERFRPGDRR